MSTKVVLDERQSIKLKATSVEVESEPLSIDFDLEILGRGPAEAIAKAIASDIRNYDGDNSDDRGPRKGKKWNVTGKLRDGITVTKVGNEFRIVAPPGRLVDQNTQDMFVEDIQAMHGDVTSRPPVARAIAQTVNLMHGGKKK